MTIKAEKLFADAILPRRATKQSAGYDLRAYLKNRSVTIFMANNSDYKTDTHSTSAVVVMPGERAMIPTGFKAQLPDNTFAHVAPRSGKALKVGLVLANAPGVIDADFPNEWMVLVHNLSVVPLVIDHGEAIAQFVVLPFLTPEVEDGTVGTSTDRKGGFGSTGA